MVRSSHYFDDVCRSLNILKGPRLVLILPVPLFGMSGFTRVDLNKYPRMERASTKIFE